MKQLNYCRQRQAQWLFSWGISPLHTEALGITCKSMSVQSLCFNVKETLTNTFFYNRGLQNAPLFTIKIIFYNCLRTCSTSSTSRGCIIIIIIIKHLNPHERERVRSVPFILVSSHIMYFIHYSYYYYYCYH